MAQYINKDVYVGDTGKQLKDIKTNADNISTNTADIKNLKNKSNVIYYKKLASRVSTLEISNIDIVRDGGVYDILFLFPSGGKSDLNMTFNNITGQYYATVVGINVQDTSSTITNSNASKLEPQKRYSDSVYYGFSMLGKPTMIMGTISLVGNRLLIQYTASACNDGGIYYIEGFTHLNYNVNNLTNIKLTPHDAVIPVGSEFLITKRNY